jgi:hypothetical protein
MALQRYDLDALVSYVKNHKMTKGSVIQKKYGEVHQWNLCSVTVEEGRRNGMLFWTRVSYGTLSCTRSSYGWTGPVPSLLFSAQDDLHIPVVLAVDA